MKMSFYLLYHALIIGLFLQHSAKCCRAVPKGKECSKLSKPTVSTVCAGASAAGAAVLCVVLPLIGCAIGGAAAGGTCAVLNEVTDVGRQTITIVFIHSDGSNYVRSLMFKLSKPNI